MNYQASIKNLTRGTWLKSERNGKTTFTRDADKRLIFYDEYDAESILEMLEYCSPSCYLICYE